MGLGKTLAAILFLAMFADYLYTNTEIEHKPILLLVPFGVVLEQWRSDITTKFPGLTMMVAYGEKAEGSMKSMGLRHFDDSSRDSLKDWSMIRAISNTYPDRQTALHRVLYYASRRYPTSGATSIRKVAHF